MKHTIRQRVINELGLPTVKHTTVYGELGSGILDKNGVEIFEGDIINVDNEGSYTVSIPDFWIRELDEYCTDSIKVVGHADD